MSQQFVATYSDAMESLADFAQAQGIGVQQEPMRRAIQTAYREIVSARDWRCFIANGRIQLQAAQTTGTVAYTHSTRTLTLSGATWPTWAADAAVRFGDIVCDIATRNSDSIVTLDPVMNPGCDVASTTYRCWPRWHVLPPDFVSMSGTMNKSGSILGQYLSPNELFQRDKFFDATGDVRYYTIAPAQDLYGSMALYVHPASSVSEPIDFTYKRRPRNLRYSGTDSADHAGTITIAAGSTSVAGTTTQFAAGHVGSILRISGNTNLPTCIEGKNPYVEQRVVSAYTNASAITIDYGAANASTGVKYLISDPIDIDIALYDAFLRCAEKHLAVSRNFPNKGECVASAEDAMRRAMESDGRVTQRMVAGCRTPVPYRLRDYATVLTDISTE